MLCGGGLIEGADRTLVHLAQKPVIRAKSGNNAVIEVASELQ